MEPLITINHVNKTYGKQQVLNDVSLQVYPGQILGLVGPNGAGKSTCLQAMLGLTDYDGDIQVLEHSPHKDRTKMLEDVAYIADVAVLPKWIRASQLVDYMASIHPKFDKEKALHFIGKTNVRLNAKVKSLSKGMVAQLHLALMLAIDAKVLVLDEPTLGLDILTRRQFYQHLLDEFYDESKCIIVTTHQIEEIEHILTDVAFIQQGKIVLAESTEEIMSRFKMVTVANEHLENASKLKPIYQNSLMGLTSMLFDQVPSQQLADFGQVSSPSLADVFVGMMTKESY